MSITGSAIKGYRILEFIDSGGFGSVYKAELDSRLYAMQLKSFEKIMC